MLAHGGSASALAHGVCLPPYITTFPLPSPRLARRLSPGHGRIGQEAGTRPHRLSGMAALGIVLGWGGVRVESSQDTFLALEFHCGKSP